MTSPNSCKLQQAGIPVSNTVIVTSITRYKSVLGILMIAETYNV